MSIHAPKHTIINTDGEEDTEILNGKGSLGQRHLFTITVNFESELLSHGVQSFSSFDVRLAAFFFSFFFLVFFFFFFFQLQSDP